jgi:bla regulator protein blaR1
MANWMFWGNVTAAGLGGIGVLAERGLALLDRPARWSWLLAMVTSVLWLFGSVVLPGGRTSAVGMAIEPPGGGGPGARMALEVAPAGRIGVLPDALLLGGWLGASSLLLVLLLASAAKLNSDRRRWERATVAGESVLVSAVQGPAVIGAVRPRIVLPRWVLDLDESLQRLIVQHEREHVRAGDSRMLVAALVLLVVLPWCLPLWWQFHRLRLAIETDCDGRLLRTGAPAREYAEVLIAVAGRRRREALPLAALSPAGAALERRIRRIVARPRAASRRAAVALLAAAALAVPVGATVLPLPPAPAPTKLAAHFRGVLPDGSLPGDPGEARLDAAIRAHHAEAIAGGLPEPSVIWFIGDWTGAVVRTGIERGSEGEVVARIRARYPEETSERVLAWVDVPAAGGGDTRVVWLLPDP